MPVRQTSRYINILFFILVVLIYAVGQFYIGTRLPDDSEFHFDAPADADFLFYAGILKQLTAGFPPQNPAFGGVVLSQSFIQYYPTAILAQFIGPYAAMRIFNFVYLLIFAFLLRRYFSKSWGIGLAVICAGSVWALAINAVGVDLIARGFNHFPFFILLIIGLFEKKFNYLRWIALFLLGSVHTYMAFLVLLALAVLALMDKFKKRSVIDVIVCACGFIPGALMTASVATRPFYFPFTNAVNLSLRSVWPHALAGLAAAYFVRDRRVLVFLFVPLVYGFIFHYNPYFPVFIVNFATGWAFMFIADKGKIPGIYVALATLLLITGYGFAVVNKYNPNVGDYFPRSDSEYRAAAQWLEENTPEDAVVMTLILADSWRTRLMETRAAYLEVPNMVNHLGINTAPRIDQIFSYFRNPMRTLVDADYVVYGPYEQYYFPGFQISNRPPVYRDSTVAIWKIKPDISEKK